MPEFEVNNQIIEIDKKVTKLDEFVLNTIGIIQKYVNYVIISGYVSIFFGRARATEDIDIFIEELPLEQFKELYKELTSKGYEFTINSSEELYNDYLKGGLPINIWKKGFPLLRIEAKFASKLSQKLQIKAKIKVKFQKKELFMSDIEAQIAYKRYICKSQKDMEDARHLEIVFPKLNKDKILHYKNIFEEEFYGK